MKTIKFQGKDFDLIGAANLEQGKVLTFKGVDQEGNVVDTADIKGKKVISVFPKLNTSVCDNQTIKVAEMAKNNSELKFIPITFDDKETIKKWCLDHGVDNITILSDQEHKDFSNKTNLLIKELQLLARGFIILDEENKIVKFDFKEEITEDPNFDII